MGKNCVLKYSVLFCHKCTPFPMVYCGGGGEGIENQKLHEGSRIELLDTHIFTCLHFSFTVLLRFMLCECTTITA